MRQIRNLGCPLNDETLKDLIASHLAAMCVIKDAEEVLTLSLSEPNEDGTRWVNFSIIELKEPELIIHS